VTRLRIALAGHSSGDAGRDARRLAAFFGRMAEYGLGERVRVAAPAGRRRRAGPGRRRDARPDPPSRRGVCARRRSRLELRGGPAPAAAVALPPPRARRSRSRAPAGLGADLGPGAGRPRRLPHGRRQRARGRRRRAHARRQLAALPAVRPSAHVDGHPDPGPAAPFTSVTQWTWEEVWLGARVLSVSKRDGYLPTWGSPAAPAVRSSWPSTWLRATGRATASGCYLAASRA